MSFLKEFREFAMRGNVVDMAVGVIIGGAFGKIVSSLVGDVVMPVLGILTGGVDFKDLKITLAQAVGETPAVTLNYGVFIQNVFDFISIRNLHDDQRYQQSEKTSRRSKRSFTRRITY